MENNARNVGVLLEQLDRKMQLENALTERQAEWLFDYATRMLEMQNELNAFFEEEDDSNVHKWADEDDTAPVPSSYRAVQGYEDAVVRMNRRLLQNAVAPPGGACGQSGVYGMTQNTDCPSGQCCSQVNRSVSYQRCLYWFC